MPFQVFAEGQSLAAGSNVPVLFDPATVIEGCGVELADDFLGVELPAATYTAFGSATFAGTLQPFRHVQIFAFDSGSFSDDSGQVAFPGPTVVVEWSFTIVDAPGFAFFFVGPGAGQSGQSITDASFFQISCGGGWTVGRVAWGTRGAWH